MTITVNIRVFNAIQRFNLNMKQVKLNKILQFVIFI
jgi:hypothetical protein